MAISKKQTLQPCLKHITTGLLSAIILTGCVSPPAETDDNNTRITQILNDIDDFITIAEEKSQQRHSNEIDEVRDLDPEDQKTLSESLGKLLTHLTGTGEEDETVYENQ